jgi:hypothetical protein
MPDSLSSVAGDTHKSNSMAVKNNPRSRGKRKSDPLPRNTIDPVLGRGTGAATTHQGNIAVNKDRTGSTSQAFVEGISQSCLKTRCGDLTPCYSISQTKV